MFINHVQYLIYNIDFFSLFSSFLQLCFSRPESFWKRINNRKYNTGTTARPVHHPNDGRFHNFRTNVQKIPIDRISEVTENEEVLESSLEDQPLDKPDQESVPYQPQMNGQPIQQVSNNLPPQRYNDMLRMQQSNEQQQQQLPTQTPSLLKRFEYFLTNTGKYINNIFG